MSAMMRALLAMAIALLVFAPAANAKSKQVEQIKADKAYLLVQVDPVEFKMMGTNRMVTGILFAPYDVEKKLVGPGVMAQHDPLAKDGKRRLFLLEIDPGTWVITGTGGSGSAMGSADTSFSLGSYHFVARAGEVLDLGVFVPQREESDNPDTKLTAGKLMGMMFMRGRVEPVPNRLDIRPRGDGDLPLPAWLASRALAQPAFVYGGTFGNSLGGLVNRIDGRKGRGRTIGSAAYLSKPGQPAVEPAAAPLPPS
jgi:hypothetical protein